MSLKIDAVSTLAAGMARQETQVDKAAAEIQAANEAAQMALAAARRESASAMPPVVDRPVVLAGGDIIRPLVSLLQAKTSYAVEAKAMKITSDIQQDAVDRMGRRIEG